MADRHSKLSVYAAIAGNFAIAVTKFIAAAVTGSSAMLSEGIHSLVDMGNGALILLGIRLSKRPPTKEHPLGHGAEIYFWSLIVAVLIFGAGGGISIYEGIVHLRNPSEVKSVAVNFIVIGLAVIFEGASWAIALHYFLKINPHAGIWKGIRRSKDPTTFVVLLEDSAALLGLLAAFLGLALGEYFGTPTFDGVASIVIGLILATVAILLIYETRGLLIGESADPAIVESIRNIAMNDESVDSIRNPITLHLGPEQILLALEIQFCDDLDTAGMASAIDRLEAAIRRAHPEVSRIFLEVESITKASSTPSRRTAQSRDGGKP